MNGFGKGAAILFIFGVLVSVGYSQPTVPAGVVAWWTGDESTNSLTVSGRPTVSLGPGVFYEDGFVGESFSFIGTAASAIHVASPSIVDTPRFSWVAWIKEGVRFSEALREIMGAWVARPGSPGFHDKKHTVQIDRNGRFIISFSGTNANGGIDTRIIQSNGRISETQRWYLMCLTYDGSLLKLYLNGAFDASIAVSGSHPSPLTLFRIGGTGGGGLPLGWPGKMDEIMIFDRAIESNEVSGIWSAGEGGFKKVVLPTCNYSFPGLNIQSIAPSNVLLRVLAPTPASRYEFLFRGTLDSTSQWELTTSFAITNTSRAFEATNAQGFFSVNAQPSYCPLPDIALSTTTLEPGSIVLSWSFHPPELGQNIHVQFVERARSASPENFSTSFPVPESSVGFVDATLPFGDWRYRIRIENINGAAKFSNISAVAFDADHDGLPDVWENLFGLDARSSEGSNGASGDPDGDGIANESEFNHGTSPISPDIPDLSGILKVWRP